MLDSGFSIPNLGQSLKKAASILEHAFSSGAGLIGFGNYKHALLDIIYADVPIQHLCLSQMQTTPQKALLLWISWVKKSIKIC